MNIFISTTDTRNEVVVDLMSRLMSGGANVCVADDLQWNGEPLSAGSFSVSSADVLIVLLDEEWYTMPSVQRELESARALIRMGKPLRVYFASLDGESELSWGDSLFDATNIFDFDALVSQVYRLKSWN